MTSATHGSGLTRQPVVKSTNVTCILPNYRLVTTLMLMVSGRMSIVFHFPVLALIFVLTIQDITAATGLHVVHIPLLTTSQSEEASFAVMIVSWDKEHSPNPLELKW